MSVLSSASQKNRREHLADAMRIEWEGLVGTYSADLWISLRHELDEILPGSAVTVFFGGQKLSVTRTQLEDLIDLVCQSYRRQQALKVSG